MNLGELDLEDAANRARGNWHHFSCFIWFRDGQLVDADQWAVIYTHHRDSGLLDQSNAMVIHRTLTPFAAADEPDVVFESHSHWAVGAIHGMSIRVFQNEQITEAFKTYHALAERIAEGCPLDEQDYCDREYEATLENVETAAWHCKQQFELPEGWSGQVYDWLSDYRCGEIENLDDQGGYPSEPVLLEAFHALGFQGMDTVAHANWTWPGRSPSLMPKCRHIVSQSNIGRPAVVTAEAVVSGEIS